MIRVLHVDDSPEEIYLTKVHLKDLLVDVEYESCLSSEEALNLLRSDHSFSVILSDYQMPVVDGLQFLSEVRKINAKLPFIFLTGQGNEEIAVDAFRGGADDYYTKEESFAHYQRLANSISRLHSTYLEHKQHLEAQAKLEKSQQLNQLILESSPVSIVFVKDHTIKWANTTFFTLFAGETESYIGKSTQNLFAGKKQYSAALEIIDQDLNKQGFADFEVQLVRKTGDPIDCNWVMRPVNPQNFQEGTIVVISDITERKKMMEQVNFQANILETVRQAVIVTKTDGQIQYINPFAEKLYGYSFDEVAGKSIYNITVHEEDLSAAEDIVDLIKSGKSWSGEFQTKHKDGSVVQVSVTNSPFVNSSGEIVGIIGVSHDISEKIAARAEQAKLEKSLKSVYEAAKNVAIVIFSPHENSLKITEFSHGAENMFGYERDEILGADISTIFQPEFTPAIEDFAEENIFDDREIKILSKDGSSIDVLFNMSPQYRPDGSIGTVIGVAVRISRLKLAQKALEETTMRLNLAVDSARIGIWEFKISEGVLYWDEWMHRIYDVPTADFTGSFKEWEKRVHPEDLEITMQLLNKAMIDGGEFNTKFRIIRGDGATRYLRAFATVQQEEDGSPIRVAGINYDITDVVLAQQKVEESEQKYRELFHNSPIAIAETDSAGVCLNANLAMAQVLGYSSVEEFLTAIDYKIKNVYVDPYKRENLVSLLERQELAKDYELQVIKKDGSHAWFSITAIKTHQQDDGSFKVESFALDITQQKHSEALFKQTRKSFQAILEHAGLIGVTLDSKAKVSFANKYFCDFSGWTPQQLLGKDWFDLAIPEEIRSEVRNVFLETTRLLNNAPDYTQYENEIIIKDGSRKLVSWTNVPHFDDGGNLVGLTGIGIDVTEREVNEEKLLRGKSVMQYAEDLAGIGSWWFDPEEQLFHVSHSWQSLMDIDKHSLTPEELGALTHPDDVEKHSRMFTQVMEAGGKYEEFFRTVIEGQPERKFKVFAEAFVLPGGIQRVYGAVIEQTSDSKDR
jgi:PAS domain S-box-containing protein